MNQQTRVPYPQAAIPVNVRPRARVVNLDAASAKPEWQTLLEAYVKANEEKNLASRTETAAKKALERCMATMGEKEHTHKIGDVTYTVTFKEGSADYVDVEELAKQVDIAALLSVASVSMTDVKSKFGSVVAAKVTRTRTTDATLKVKK